MQQRGKEVSKQILEGELTEFGWKRDASYCRRTLWGNITSSWSTKNINSNTYDMLLIVSNQHHVTNNTHTFPLRQKWMSTITLNTLLVVFFNHFQLVVYETALYKDTST